jgi:hypothetical protein
MNVMEWMDGNLQHNNMHVPTTGSPFVRLRVYDPIWFHFSTCFLRRGIWVSKAKKISVDGGDAPGIHGF